MEYRLVVWLRVVWQLKWLVQSMEGGLWFFIFIFLDHSALPGLLLDSPPSGTEVSGTRHSLIVLMFVLRGRPSAGEQRVGTRRSLIVLRDCVGVGVIACVNVVGDPAPIFLQERI